MLKVSEKLDDAVAFVTPSSAINLQVNDPAFEELLDAANRNVPVEGCVIVA